MRMVLAIAALVSIAVGLIAVGRAWYERAPAADGQRTSSVTSGGQLAVDVLRPVSGLVASATSTTTSALGVSGKSRGSSRGISLRAICDQLRRGGPDGQGSRSKIWLPQVRQSGPYFMGTRSENRW
jgi:hypothetical protein